MKRVICSIVLATALGACTESADAPVEPIAASTGFGADIQAAVSIDVSNVTELYSAVNNSANEGALVRLAPGTYVLTASSGGTPRPNGGRLELQPGMSLTGVEGDRSAVTIDLSQLPNASFTVALGKTGGIRLGRGSNAVEWITIDGNPNSAAGIESDLADTHSAEVIVAHIIARGSIRGIDLRNVGVAMSGRELAARVDDNEFYGNTEGVRYLNLNGAVGGAIDVSMSGNRIHDNTNGCIIEHNRASGGTIRVRSSGDRFEHNTLGCLIGGGLVAAPGVANSNVTEFEGHGDSFSDNTLDVTSIDKGGLVVVAAETPGAANSASNNHVTVSLWGTAVSGNQNIDFQAYGARSTAAPAGISGTGNTVTINLYGVSKKIAVTAVASIPFEAAGTNTVSINR
jgi:hypothetical protein